MLTSKARNVLPIPSNKPFWFQGCLYSKCRVRHHSTLPSRASSTRAGHTIPASVEDKALVSLFDHQNLGVKSSSFSSTGIFGHHSLTHPRALISLADATLLRAQMLTERILRARESHEELLKVVKNLDRLSDMLCGVIDLAELIRNAHPDRIWVDAANDAYEKLCEFMNILNTHVGLYDVCDECLNPVFLGSQLRLDSKGCAVRSCHC